MNALSRQVFAFASASTLALCGYAQAPAITSFNPPSGPVGAMVTVTGRDFSPTASNNIVLFGILRAPVTSASSNSLTVLVPAGATLAPIKVTVGGRTAMSFGFFNPTFPGGFNVTFAPRTNYSVGTSPRYVAVGDFNGDGIPDIATANVWSGNVTALFGTGGGGLGGRMDLAAGVEPVSLAVGDFNGDGISDLAACEGTDVASSMAAVWLGSPTGTFSSRMDFSVGDYPASITAADLDSDGLTDLATANARGHTLSVLLGDGAGSFGARTDFTTGVGGGSAGDVLGIAAGDFDRNGDWDLVSGSLSGSGDVLSIHWGDGSGNFTLGTNMPVGAFPREIVTGDFNRDGLLDLATADTDSNSISVFIGSSNGLSWTRTDFPVGDGPHGIATGDFNGDGIPDLVTANRRENTTTVLLGDGLDAFGWRSDLAVSNGAPYSVAVGDFDGDGKPDIVTANAADNAISVFLNTTVPPPIPTIVQQPLSRLAEVGTNVSLEVVATGTPPPYYQWFKDGVVVSNATQATLSFDPVLLSDAGNYFVVVSNAAGSVVSSNAVLAVLPPGAPIILVNGQLVAGSVTEVFSATIIMESQFDNGVIFYTLDGSTPDFGSPIYSSPMVVSETTVVNALGLDVDTFDTAEAPAVTIVFLPTYTLTLTTSGSGTVAATPSPGPYASNTFVSVTAVPDSGWVFDHWSGSAGGSANPLSLTMNGSLSVQGVFVPLYPVTAVTAGGGSVAVTPAQSLYPSNSVVSISATASNGWTFMQWQGDASGTDNPLSLTVDAPKNVSAVFGTSVGTSVIGSGMIELNVPNPIPYGTVVQATAAPDPGWVFDHWSGDAGGSVNPLSVAVNRPLSVQAVFLQVVYPVTATTAGGGSVSMSPDVPLYPSNSVVSVSATASNGWTFLQWQGDAGGTDNPLSLTVDAPKSVSALFGVSVGTSVIGSGVIELNASNPIAYGTVVQATAVPNSGSYFVQWGSALTGTNSPAQFTVVSTNPVRAVFGNLQPGQVALSVRIVGFGSVDVTPKKQVYTVGDSVTLTATALGGINQFDGWGGDLVSASNSVVVTLDTSMVVTANFRPATPVLHITQQDSIVQLHWSAPALYYCLETTTNLSGSAWTTPNYGPQTTIVGNEVFVTLGATNTQQFFRLKGSMPISISQFAIFFNSLLEFTWSAEFTINGRVHANGSIYTGSKQRLTFNGPVTATGVIASPSWGGHATSEYTYKGTFNGNPARTTNVPTAALSINMTNSHTLIEMPPAGEVPDSDEGKQRLYNQANVVLLISNSIVTARLQEGPVPGADPSKLVLTSSVSPLAVSTNLPFLTLLWGTNGFTDQREGKTILASQIDVEQYETWLNSPLVRSKFNAANGEYPTILYVADNRTTTSAQLTAVRLVNGLSPPANGGLGFTLATPDPLYVWGHYNCPNTNYLGSTDTVAAGTVPCALLSDAITMLSPNWRDNQSSWDLGNSSKNDAASMTVNAAILSGLVYSTGPNTGQFSGGVMNLPRLLENWGNGQNQVLTLNTALINLYASKRATAQFRDPGDYYYAPKRNFNFDTKFLDPSQQPPGMPVVSIPFLP